MGIAVEEILNAWTLMNVMMGHIHVHHMQLVPTQLVLITVPVILVIQEMAQLVM